MHWNPSPHFLPWPCFHMLLLSVYCTQQGHQAVALLGGPPVLGWEVWAQCLQQHCCTSTQAFFLPSLLYSGSDPHPPSSSVLVFSVSSCKGTNPTPGMAPSWPNFLPRPRIQTQSRWRLGLPHLSVGGSQTFSPYQLPTKKFMLSIISYQK